MADDIHAELGAENFGHGDLAAPPDLVLRNDGDRAAALVGGSGVAVGGDDGVSFERLGGKVADAAGDNGRGEFRDGLLGGLVDEAGGGDRL